MLRRAAVRFSVMASVSAGLWLVACGGSPKPVEQAAPGGSGSAHAGHPDHPPASTPPKKPELVEPSARTAADHHREFMAGCARKAANSPDYCECAWGEFRKAFTGEQMNAGDLPAPKLDKLKGQVVGACSSKVNEEMVKDTFGNGCVAKNPEMKTYCDCLWGEYRKKFSPAELNDEETIAGERFLSARGPVTKTCAAKMPESVSKEAFMKGCAKESTSDKFCGCAWKELRKQASPGEIEAGSFDQKTVFAQVEKSCGKLRPAATK